MNDLRPPDQGARDRILNELRTTFLVEAAAGTGKTTSMVGRMVELLAEGVCEIHRLAAITFTRKAAAELRDRFQTQLASSSVTATGLRAVRLRSALEHVDRVFIGTIHSFCAHLLRERPVEAGVDLSFQEMEEQEDRVFRKQAWEEYAARLYAEGSPLLEKLDHLGLSLGQLENAFFRIADFPDVEEWPRPEVPLPDLKQVVKRLRGYVNHMKSLAAKLPSTWGNDRLIPAYHSIPRMVRWKNLDDPAQLMEVLERFDRDYTIVQSRWVLKDKTSADKDLAEREKAAWDGFREEVVKPALQVWYHHRYPTALEIILPALSVYERLKQEAGKLNYQDLLLKAAALLKDKPGVRRYFRRRFTHLLVDEFQDTDPIQAEVMMLLTSRDPCETEWRKCRPVEGSLFVVGDPKQSIYRFRRADIVTYNAVKEIILESGGSVVHLSTNFRTVEPILEWVNQTFQPFFDEEGAPYSPEYVGLEPGRRDTPNQASVPICKLVPRAKKKYDSVLLESEAGQIARYIRRAVDVQGTTNQNENDSSETPKQRFQPDDFLIIPYRKKSLAKYAAELQKLGIPHEVSGGDGATEIRELALLMQCLNALIHPENPVLLVAVLRGELFGMSDECLYRFRSAGGRFHYGSAVPEHLAPEVRDRFEDTFGRLKKYAHWLQHLAPVPALERIAGDLGLIALAASHPEGNFSAGGFFKSLETLRSQQSSLSTLGQLLESLNQVLSGSVEFDTFPARSRNRPAVRIMNLHKAKGLEAPVVFLADPSRPREHAVEIHIDRSQDRTQGYLHISQPFGEWGQWTLAIPKEWEKISEEERKFLEAEKNRLLYVAATRPRDCLIVTEGPPTEEGKRSRYWERLTRELEDAPSLEDGPSPKVEMEEVSVFETEEFEKEVDDIRERWREVLHPTYSEAAAKQVSISDTRPVTGSGREFGSDWGTLVHSLLEVASSDSVGDLREIARAQVDRMELPTRMVEEALEVVSRVRESEIWRKALRSPQRFVEIPFETLWEFPQPVNETLDEDLQGKSPAPERTFLRGVIDLVFRDSEGWILVDYKTDRVREKNLSDLTEHYRPQIDLYARVWEDLTKESVKERGLYFTHLNQYVPLGNE